MAGRELQNLEITQSPNDAEEWVFTLSNVEIDDLNYRLMFMVAQYDADDFYVEDKIIYTDDINVKAGAWDFQSAIYNAVYSAWWAGLTVDRKLFDAGYVEISDIADAVFIEYHVTVNRRIRHTPSITMT